MAADPEFLAHITDLFAGYGPIRSGRLSGGTSLYVEDAMFAVIFGDTVYMKSDKGLRPRFDERDLCHFLTKPNPESGSFRG